MAASFVGDGSKVSSTLQSAVAAYDLRQMSDGRGGVNKSQKGFSSGQLIDFTETGRYSLPKTAGIALLDGGRAYWDRSAGAVHFKKVNDQDYLLGSICGDAASGDANCVVNLDKEPRYVVDLARDPFTPLPVLTSGNPSISRRGGAHLLLLDSTNEAEKIDSLTDDGFSTPANAIIEAAIKVVADDSGTAATFSLGVANATHATAWTSIADSLGIQLKAHDGKIYAASKTASVTVAPTDTTKTYAVGTRFEVWFDMRNPASCGVYIEGVQVLASAVFDVSASVATWFLLTHLVKSSSTDTMQVQVDWLRARIAEQ